MLVVVDSSVSMQPAQTALADSFSALTAYAQSAQVDWHLAAVTMDPAALGVLRADGLGTKVVTPATPNAEDVFRSLVQPGIGGSNTQLGLASAAAALSWSSTSSGLGFLRDEASLGVLVVSNAKDESYSQASLFYLAQMQAVKGARRRNQLSVSGVLPTLAQAPAGCFYADAVDSQSAYGVVILNSGGRTEEICDATVSAWLGEVAFGRRPTWYLRAPPVGGTTVQVNGVTLPPSAYSYDPSHNAITIQDSLAPRAGDMVSVSYTTACQ